MKRPPPSPDLPIEEAVRVELARDLYEQGRLALPLALGLVLALPRVLGRSLLDHPRTLGCYIALLAAMALRWAQVLAGSGELGPWASARLRMWVFAGGALLTGLGLAAVSGLAYGRLDPLQIALLGLVHLGLLSVGVLSMSASPTAFTAYLAPVLGVLAWLLARDTRAWGAWELLSLLAFCGLGLSLLILRQFRMRRDSLRLSLENSRAALRDSLTGLRNRRFLQAYMETESERLLRETEGAEPGEAPGLALFVLDLDHFKQVNDTRGHAAGDAVLLQCAERLARAARRADVLVRWGGDEFVVAAQVPERGEAVERLAARYLEALRAEPFRLPDGGLALGASLGYAVFPFFPGRPTLLGWERVLALADAALLRAKAAGRGRLAGVLPGGPGARPDAELLEAFGSPESAEAAGLFSLRCAGPD